MLVDEITVPEASRRLGVSERRVRALVAADDLLSEHEQSIVQIAQRREALNLEAEFIAAGESWSESDDDGNLIIRSR